MHLVTPELLPKLKLRCLFHCHTSTAPTMQQADMIAASVLGQGEEEGGRGRKGVEEQ